MLKFAGVHKDEILIAKLNGGTTFDADGKNPIAPFFDCASAGAARGSLVPVTSLF